jgi:hypothetical protein
MRIYKILFFSALLFFIACKHEPEGIIKKDNMANILTDIHIVDGGTYALPQLPDTLYKYALPKYLAVFKKYGTDTVQFNKSFRYYAEKPEDLDAIYDEVLKKIQFKTDSVNKVKTKEPKKVE